MLPPSWVHDLETLHRGSSFRFQKSDESVSGFLTGMFTPDTISPTDFYIQDRTLIGKKHPISSAHNGSVPPDPVARLSAVFLDCAGGDVLFF